MFGYCAECGPTKLYKKKNVKSSRGFSWQCKAQKDKWRGGYQYRLNSSQLGSIYYDRNAELDSFDGKCELCEVEIEKPHLDHCHETGKIRGWLCRNCNVGLGMFKDDTEILQKAIKYLSK